MDSIKTTSTSDKSADVADVVLRAGTTSRLVFRPEIVENPNDANAGVRGTFLYQRKGRNDEWSDTKTIGFNTLKKGEGYKLEIPCAELLKLYQQLTALYELHAEEGVPAGDQEFVRVDRKLAAIAKLPSQKLRELLEANAAISTSLLVGLLRWATSADDPAELIRGLTQLDGPSVSRLNLAASVGALQTAMMVWHDNEETTNEEFWQSTLTDHSFVLESVFSWPSTIVKEKAYVGGKTISNTGGKIVDFMLKNRITRSAALVEIKTPATRLLGKEYRQGVFAPSDDVSGSITQVLTYKHSLAREYTNLVRGQEELFDVFDPPCAVIVGNASKQLSSTEQRQSFELFRSQLSGVRIITFDELFGRTSGLIDVLERSEGGGEDDDNLPF